MDILKIEYRKLDSVAGSARRLADKISRRIDDYEGISRDLGRISTSRSNISSCQRNISRKISSLQEKENALRSFATKAEDYVETAKNVDRKVANRIKSSTESFKKNNNIKVGLLDHIVAGIEMWIRKYFGRAGALGRMVYAELSEGTRDIKNNIRRWYHDEGGKYIVDAAVDIVLLVGTIALAIAFPATTALAVFFAAFEIYKGASDIYYDVSAYRSFKQSGNKAYADRENEKGGREMTVEIVGETAEAIAGEDAADGARAAANWIYTGVDVAAAVYNIKEVYSNFSKKWKHFSTADNKITSIADFKDRLKTFDSYENIRSFTLVDPKDRKAANFVKFIDGFKNEPRKITALKVYEGYKSYKGAKKGITSVIDIFKTSFKGFKTQDTMIKTVKLDNKITDAFSMESVSLVTSKMGHTPAEISGISVNKYDFSFIKDALKPINKPNTGLIKLRSTAYAS